jgi:hypothetical protein
VRTVLLLLCLVWIITTSVWTTWYHVFGNFEPAVPSESFPQTQSGMRHGEGNNNMDIRKRDLNYLSTRQVLLDVAQQISPRS